MVRLVIVESPFAGDVERNTRYARAALRDCLMRGDAPLASHLLYTQPGVLDDSSADERDLGMGAGWAWMQRADAVLFYIDLGFSDGMREGLLRAKDAGLPIEERWLGGGWS